MRVGAIAGAIFLTLAAWTVFRIQTNLEERYGDLQEVPLEGSESVIATLAGSWYQDDLVLMARVSGGTQPSLAVRFDSRCKVHHARVAGEGLEFDHTCSDENGATGLRFIAPGEVLWSRPGEPHSGCANCTPTLTRAGAWTRTRRWTGILSEIASGLVSDRLDAFELWCVRHL